MTQPKFLQYVTKDTQHNCYFLNIPLDEKFEGVQIRSVTMDIGSPDDEDYFDGDLAVNWDTKGLQNDGGGDMGSLMMRGGGDEVGKVMGRFYWDHAFDARLHKILQDAGFDPAAAFDVSGSEWGMQDEGRASYDAFEVADAVRAALQAVSADAEV